MSEVFRENIHFSFLFFSLSFICFMEVMKLSTEVSGFFGDIPYCSPVESSLFYDIIASTRVHRVSEKLMTKANTHPFFIEDNTTSSNFLCDLNRNISYLSGVSRKELDIMDAVPSWLHSLAYQRIYPGNVNATCFMKIELVASREDSCTHSTSERMMQVMPWNMKEIDQMWKSLWIFLIGESDSEGNGLYILQDVDIFLSTKNPYGRFMFSVWAMGVSCILHYFDSMQINCIHERLDRVSIRMTLLHGNASEIIADDIHLFLENKLRIGVERMQSMADTEKFLKKIKPTNTISVGSIDEWLESISELVVSIHEVLCDSCNENDKSKDNMRQCILILLPEIKMLRQNLEKCLSDSYTSVPILIASCQYQVYCLLSESADQRVPITIFASRQILEDQLLLPEHERFFSRLDIKAVIITDEDSFAHDNVILRSITTKSLELHVMQCPHTTVYEEEEVTLSKKNDIGMKFLQEGMNLLLLLFRRFKFPLSKDGVQPVFRPSLTAFLSQDASSYFDKVISSLQSNGLISSEEEADGSFAFALNTLGRLLSYRFRLPYERKHPELTVFDAKCIFWCHALRQSKQTAMELILKAHYAPFWVQDAMDEFCLRHRIVLEKEVPVDLKMLVQELSQGVQETEKHSRVKMFLRYSSGIREPISKHLIRNPSTSCRGWFDQTPMQANVLTLPKPHVTIYCYPSLNELCEIRFGGRVLQCPLDLSYPLIVAHIVSHTALRNNAIFLEYDQCLEAAPLLSLPLAVIQSPTFRSFLESDADDSVGYWLDSCMGANPTISDPMELSSLMAKTTSFLGLCNRGVLRRKRFNEEESIAKRSKEEMNQEFKRKFTADAEAIEEFAKAALKLGRECAEKRFKGVRGFAFLDPSHENHGYYLSLLERDAN